MRLYLFGNWKEPEAADLDDNAKALLAFLEGRSDDMTPEMAASLRKEWHAQEQYRMRLAQEIHTASKVLQDLSAAEVPSLEMPHRVTEQYAAGYNAGQHSAYAEAAQLISNITNKAAREIVG